jgi:hypothetical protein
VTKSERNIHSLGVHDSYQLSSDPIRSALGGKQMFVDGSVSL